MRLAIAAALLANTLPAFSQRSSKVEALEDRKKLAESLYKALAQNRFESTGLGQQQDKNSGSVKRKFIQGGRLKNPPSKIKPVLVECDPDVGVLSCGHGTYCEASPDASMGGFCLPPFDQSQRGLQQLSPVNGNSTGPTVYCDPSSEYYLTGANGTIDCDCSDWSADNSTGTLSCQVYTNYCYEGCNNTCYAVDFTYTTSDDATSFTYCYDFTQPYNQQFCFGSVDAQNCLISVDGTACSSCLANNRLNCESGTCETESCFDFNCENIGLGTGNTCDDPVYPPAFYECYNSLPGDYDQCLICPNDNTAYPESLVSISGYGDFNCSYVAEIGYYGYLNPTTCSETTALASGVCCAPQEPFVCNFCREEGSFITNPDAFVEIPGQPSRTCDAIQTSATLGDISENECALVQGFVLEKCGCSGQDVTDDGATLGDRQPVTESPTTTPASSAASLTEETVLSVLLLGWLMV